MNNKLDKNSIPHLYEISKQPDFPYVVDEDFLGLNNSDENQTVQIYGVYKNPETLISVVTAIFREVFPNKEAPNGKIVYIFNVYTHPNYRRCGYASRLIDCVWGEAKKFNADYIYCDDHLIFRELGFVPLPGEDRLYLKL